MPTREMERVNRGNRVNRANRVNRVSKQANKRRSQQAETTVPSVNHNCKAARVRSPTRTKYFRIEDSATVVVRTAVLPYPALHWWLPGNQTLGFLITCLVPGMSVGDGSPHLSGGQGHSVSVAGEVTRWWVKGSHSEVSLGFSLLWLAIESQPWKEN